MTDPRTIRFDRVQNLLRPLTSPEAASVVQAFLSGESDELKNFPTADDPTFGVSQGQLGVI